MIISSRPLRSALAALIVFATALTTRAAPATGSVLFTPTADNIGSIRTEKAPVLSLDTSTGTPALKVEFTGGSGYPGLDFPIAGKLDLPAFAGVQVDVTNISQERLNINLRADNPGDWKKSPWNTNNAWIAPGETKTIKLTFGQSYGNSAYPLDASRISVIKLFAATPKQASAIVVKNLRPFGTGTPPAAPIATASPSASTVVSSPGVALFDPATATGTTGFNTGEGTQLALVNGALEAMFPAMSGYPSFDFAKPAGGWNLSAFAGVQVEVVNTGTHAFTFALRVDNAGDWRQQPWNTEQTRIAPGETKTLKVVFGRTNGGKPGYAIDPAKVTVVKVFAVNPTKGGTLQVKKLSGFGTPGSAPAPTAASSSATPAVTAGVDATFSPSIGGELLDLAKANPLAGFVHSDSSAVVEDGKIKVTFNAGSNYPNIQFPIPKGGWNLSAFGGIELAVTNPTAGKVRVFLRADNPGHWKTEPWNTENLTIGAGETKVVKLTFGQQNGAPGFPLNPARIIAIQLFITKPKADTTLILSDLKGSGSPADAANNLSLSKPEDRNVPAVLPAWLGQRPPVEIAGEWVKTLDENFDGNKLDDKLWTPRFPWDGPQPGQLQRYAPENVTVGNGVASFKVEKRFGHENNDPSRPTRNYTSGLIQSYNKWTQLYGYFEARIKVPYVRGLWPAYWMMPDRSAASGLEMWRRRDTGNGGMEIDIMEILSEWGPGRNSVATHWDGYGADHKQWGTSQIYYGPTPDGWHVFGLLWEPGKLTWYVDGKKVAEKQDERVGSVPSYLKFNVQMGGWATKDVDDANLPATMEVDYTRAWQLKSRL